MTHDNTSNTATLFIKSLPQSGFNNVYRNNMDEHSFISDPNGIIQHMLLDTKTAAFMTESAGKSTEEYSNCQVFVFSCCDLGKHCTSYLHTLMLSQYQVTY